MTKKFSLKCSVGDQDTNIDFFVGDPHETSHPIGYQMKFLSSKGVKVPEEIIQAMTKLNEIAKNNRIPFEEMIGYVSEQLQFGDVLKDNILSKNKVN